MKPKVFKPYERITVKGLLVNAIRRDMSGYFLKEMLQGPKKGMYLVKISDTELFVPPEQVISEEQALLEIRKQREGLKSNE